MATLLLIGTFFGLSLRDFFTDKNGQNFAKTLPKYPNAIGWEITGNFNETSGAYTTIKFTRDPSESKFDNKKFVSEYTKLLEKDGFEPYKVSDWGEFMLYSENKLITFKKHPYCVSITEYKVAEENEQEFLSDPNNLSDGILIGGCK